MLRPDCDFADSSIRSVAPSMFDTIILLTGPAEHSVFTTLLRGHNPALTIVPVFTPGDLTALEPEWLGRARLISFATTVSVPGEVLGQLGYGAFNFHPGPPTRPGPTPAHFAVDERAPDFGCTLHRMVERIDAGPIVEVDVFPIPQHITVGALEEMTYTRLVQMFWRMARVLASEASLPVERALRWSEQGPRVRYQQRRGSVPAVRQDEFEHRTDVFGSDQLSLAPRSLRPGFGSSW